MLLVVTLTQLGEGRGGGGLEDVEVFNKIVMVISLGPLLFSL